jgi:hypothetical protein
MLNKRMNSIQYLELKRSMFHISIEYEFSPSFLQPNLTFSFLTKEFHSHFEKRNEFFKGESKIKAKGSLIISLTTLMFFLLKY